MSLTEEVEFSKEGRIERFPWAKKFFLSLVVILVALLSFGLGRLSGTGNRESIRIEYDPALTSLTSQTASVIKSSPISPTSQNEGVIASKNGKKYHYLHCPGAKQISEANKIVFSSPAAAEASGYTLATNCKKR